MTVFEDKLRARPFWTDRPVVALSKEERDALADALAALRELHRVSGGLGEGEQWQAAGEALARLDNT